MVAKDVALRKQIYRSAGFRLLIYMTIIITAIRVNIRLIQLEPRWHVLYWSVGCLVAAYCGGTAVTVVISAVRRLSESKHQIEKSAEALHALKIVGENLERLEKNEEV